MAEFNNLNELHELCRLRSNLEAFAAVRLHAHPNRSAFLKQSLAHLKVMKKLAGAARYVEFHAEDMKLHRALVMSVDIPVLVKCWDEVAGELEDWIKHVKRAYWPSLMTLYREHEFLIQAWASDQPWVAEQATHYHLEAGWFRVASSHGNLTKELNPVDRATSFICTHYASAIDVEWLAQHVGFVSASHLTRLFRERLAVSPHAFLKRVRMERAAELIRTQQDAVNMIAAKVGYKNVSHFVRDFKAAHEITPRRYRDRCLSEWDGAR